MPSRETELNNFQRQKIILKVLERNTYQDNYVNAMRALLPPPSGIRSSEIDNSGSI
jgi:hypothetical protein